MSTTNYIISVAIVVCLILILIGFVKLTLGFWLGLIDTLGLNEGGGLIASLIPD